MQKQTRILFEQLLRDMARTYGVTSVARQFAIEPSIAQELKDKTVEQSTFLPRINIFPVTELSGQKLFGKSKGSIASRTDTTVAGVEREPKHNMDMEDGLYQLHQTNFDTAIRYDMLDLWAKFPDFYERYTRYNYEQMANDTEIIGWHGTHAAKDTDLAAYPLLQDVNKGWMQHMRENRAQNILVDGKTSGVIVIGQGGDYLNLDEAVFDLKQGIPYYLRQNLIALIGDDLVAKEEASLYHNQAGTPTEKILIGQSKERFGGLDWDTPSNFPSRGLVITSLDNLSLYYQEGGSRRFIKDKPEKDQVEDYISYNEGYVVEDTEKFVAWEFDNVKFAGE